MQTRRQAKQGFEARMDKGNRLQSAPGTTSYKIGYVKRAMLHTVAMPLLAIAGVLGLAGAPAAGQNMSIGMSDPYEQFSPELGQRDIALFTRVLQLSPAEAQAVQSLYDGYYNGLRENFRRRPKRRWRKLRRLVTRRGRDCRGMTTRRPQSG